MLVDERVPAVRVPSSPLSAFDGTGAEISRHSVGPFDTGRPEGARGFEYWREVVCATFVRLAAEPLGADGFSGSIEHMQVADIGLSTVASGPQRVRRTPQFIAMDDDEYLLASIQVSGRGRVEQDGRVAMLSVGDVVFYDSARPYALEFDGPFEQLVAQVPKRELNIDHSEAITARVLGPGTPGPVVASLLASVAETSRVSSRAGTLMASHAIDLVAAAAAFAGRGRASEPAVDAMQRERMLNFMRHNLADAHLNADAIARACNVSRRTLYRIVGEDGVSRRLRTLRIEQARRLLIADLERSIGSIACQSGFESESGFYRAFRAATGMTPAEFRRRSGTRGQ